MRIEDAVQVFANGYALSRSVGHPLGVTKVSDIWVLRDAPVRAGERSSELIGISPSLEQVNVAAARAGSRWTLSFVEPGTGDSAPWRAPRDLRNDFRRVGTEKLMVAEPTGQVRTDSQVIRVRTPELTERIRRANRGRRLVPDDQIGSQDGPFRLFAALKDDSLLGWVSQLEVAGGGGYVCSLYVLPNHRSHGTGRMLMSALADDAAQRGVQTSVLTSSQAGSTLYRQLGYQQLATVHLLRPRDYGSSVPGRSSSRTSHQHEECEAYRASRSLPRS